MSAEGCDRGSDREEGTEVGFGELRGVMEVEVEGGVKGKVLD